MLRRWAVVVLVLSGLGAALGCHRAVGSDRDGGTPNDAVICDWEALYAVAIYGDAPTQALVRCPTGHNCVPGQGGAAGCDVTDGDDICRPVGQGYTCSAITGQLMIDPGQTCADIDPEYICYPLDPARPFAGPSAGSLLGFCQPPIANTVVRNVGDNCNYVLELCVPGALCIGWGPGDEGQGRCLALCDAGHPDGSTVACGAGEPTCQSLSLRCDPVPDPPFVRMGLCGAP